MGKFNTKNEGVKPTETNFMGENAFEMEAKDNLVSTVMTTFLTDSYYEKEKPIVYRICGSIDDVDPLFAAKLAIYTRNKGNMRSVTHLIAAYITKYVSGKDWAKRFYNKIVVRPDDMTEILSAYAKINGMSLKKIKKIPNAMKKGFKESLECLSPYQIDKYKMNNRAIKLVDLVRLFHPKGNENNSIAYEKLIKGESLEDLYNAKILEKELTKAGQSTKELTEEDKLSAKREAITSVLTNVSGMPIMNLLRNLRNILLYAPNMVDEACKQLTIENKILNSRLLPFRFATAYSEIEKMTFSLEEELLSNDIQFESDVEKQISSKEEFNEKKKQILNAIETALEISCSNIPTLEGNTAILIDDSGSMRGSSYNSGTSRVSAFSNTNNSKIAHLFASMVAYKQKDVYIGMFGDELIQVPMKRDMKLLDYSEWSYNEGEKCGGATEAGIYEFMRKAVDEKKKIDNVIVFSDCQIGNGRYFTSWYGTDSVDRRDNFHELFNRFRKINPNANFIVCNLKQHGKTSVFDKSQRILNIAGWSDKIFDVITSGTKGFEAMIKEIEAIEI